MRQLLRGTVAGAALGVALGHRTTGGYDRTRIASLFTAGTEFRFGRKPTLTHHQQREAIKRVKTAKETQGEIAGSYNVSRWTISRLSA